MKHIKAYQLFESDTSQVWYHGTDSKFDKFDMSKTKSGPSAFGLWFTDDPELAKIFGQNIFKCKLSYTNPKIITMDEWDEIRGEHAKDTGFFRTWKTKLLSNGYDSLFVKERKIEFAGHTVRDGNMVALFDQDHADILQESTANEHVNESRGIGSLILISGIVLDDGTRRLYAVPTKSVSNQVRKKTDNTVGASASMATLGNDIYRISNRNGVLSAGKVIPQDRKAIMKMLGISDNLQGNAIHIVVNSKTGKTPLHWLSIKYTNITKMIKEIGDSILSLPDIRWTN